jgi:hypothetical protein
MTKFKAGDRVRFVGKATSLPSNMGTVVDYHPTADVIFVSFDNYRYDWLGGASAVPYHTAYGRVFVLDDENL